MPDAQFLTVVGLGFLLGARHALDADHIAAVSTIVSERPNLRASGLIGLCWGIGHTVVLLIVGAAIVAFKVNIPASIADWFELAVGMMLVGLGVSLAVKIARERWHYHEHDHDGQRHLHLHSHRERTHHEHPHWFQGSLKPFAVGMVHGLAGSAALALMVVSTVRTVGETLLYIAIFGLGSILGMVLLGTVIAVPLIATASMGQRACSVVQGLASLASIGLGLTIIARFPFV